MKPALLALVFAFAAVPARADFRLRDDAQLWAPVFLNAPAPAPWKALLEVNPRVRGDFRRLNHLLVRPWLGADVGGGRTLHAGYAWIRNEGLSDEQRVWEQLTQVLTLGHQRLTLRGRLEQRFIQRDPETALRGRFMVRGDHKLRWASGQWYAAAYSETFVNLNDSRLTRSGFDQHRFFLGLGRGGLGPARVEAGYQHWYQQRKSGRDSTTHVLLINTYLGG